MQAKLHITHLDVHALEVSNRHSETAALIHRTDDVLVSCDHIVI